MSFPTEEEARNANKEQLKAWLDTMPPSIGIDRVKRSLIFNIIITRWMNFIFGKTSN